MTKLRNKGQVYLGICCVLTVLLGGCGTTRTVQIKEDTKIVIPRKKNTPVDAASSESENARLQPPPQDQPMQIRSDRMVYQEQGKVTLFTGNVRLHQEDAWLFTPYLQVRTEEGTASARQGVRLIDHQRGVTLTAKALDYTDDLNNIKVRDHVHVTTHDEEGVTLKIYADAMEWHKKKEAVLAQGDVVVHYKDTTATADVMSFDQRQRKMTLSQRADTDTSAMPVVIQKENRITGKTITMHIKEKTYEVDGSAQAMILPEQKQAKAQE